MRFALGFAFAQLLGIAVWFGYTSAMTADGPFIQGYIGAAIPAVLVFSGVALGAILGARK